jgi:hypothetical protein
VTTGWFRVFPVGLPKVGYERIRLVDGIKIKERRKIPVGNGLDRGRRDSKTV